MNLEKAKVNDYESCKHRVICEQTRKAGKENALRNEPMQTKWRSLLTVNDGFVQFRGSLLK